MTATLIPTALADAATFPLIGPNLQHPAVLEKGPKASKAPAVRGWQNYLHGHGTAVAYGINCARSGLVVIDLDTDDGQDGPGAWAAWLADLERDAPATLEQATPNGDGRARHLIYRAHPTVNVPMAGAILPGVDLRAGWTTDDTATSAGYIVGPGSTIIRDDGQPGTYTVTADRPIAELPKWLARGLLDLIATSKPTPAAPTRPEPPRLPRTGTGDAWLTGAVDGALGDLAETAAMPEGAVDRHGKTWETGALQARARRLVEVANVDPGVYPPAQARADYLAAAPPGHEDRFAHHWDSAVQHVGDRPADRPEPRPSTLAAEFATAQQPSPAVDGDQDTAPLEQSGDGDGKRPALAVTLRQHVEDHYEIFPAADDERIYAQPKAGGRAELLDGGFIIRAAPALGRAAGNLSTSATEAAKVLAAIAATQPPRPIALRADHRPGQIVLDLAQPGSGRCVVVTPTGWSIQNSPPPGVVFTETGRPLPDPIRGGHIDELRTLLRWTEDDPRWPLVKGWLPAALLADVPRPMLAIFGPQGSAKTTTGRFVAGLIDPKPAGTLGSGFGKNRTDDETKAVRSYIPAWDNVSTMSGDSADFLSRMVTGDLIERRKLYTDASIAEVHYRRTAVVTGIAVPRGIKPDTLDRLILIDVQPLTGPRVSEGELGAEWEHVHPRALAGVLDLTVGMLARLETARGHNTAGLRMADYAEALWAIDPALYAAYADNVSDARGDMAADDPFIQTLRRWLNARGGQWEGTAADAVEDAEWFRASQDTFGAPTGWWPANGRTFAREVTKQSELLRAVGITVTDRRSNGQKLKTFAQNVTPDTGSQTGSQGSACDPLRPSCDPPESGQTQWQEPESTQTGSQGSMNAGTPLFPSKKDLRAEEPQGLSMKAPQLATLATLSPPAPAEALDPPRCDNCGDYLTDAAVADGHTTHPTC